MRLGGSVTGSELFLSLLVFASIAYKVMPYSVEVAKKVQVLLWEITAV